VSICPGLTQFRHLSAVEGNHKPMPGRYRRHYGSVLDAQLSLRYDFDHCE
jgi:hypothetical protein